MNIVKGWTPEQKAKFRHDVFLAGHNLAKTGLFTDDALTHLLDQHPTEKLDVCMMPEAGKTGFQTGDFREADGKTLIDLVKRGDIWINIRRAMNLHPDYKIVLDELYSELSKMSGMKFYNPRGGILVSSPTAVVPYHCDATETMLWHIRGQKRVYVYPNTEEFLIETEYEDQIANQINDYLTYRPDMDKHAYIHDLQPGEVMCWPHNTPHKVVNKSYCVSVTTEYTSLKSLFKNSGVYANAYLRQKFGRNPSWNNAPVPERVLKAGLGQFLRRAGAIKPPANYDMVNFRVNKNVPGYIETTEPFERNF